MGYREKFENKISFEEFKNSLKMQYTFGMTSTDGASRRYYDSKMNIGCEVHTPRDEETGEWGKSKKIYYIETSKKNHYTLESLYKEWVNELYREECEKLFIENKEMKALIDWLWENEPEKTEMLDRIQEYLENNNES